MSDEDEWDEEYPVYFAGPCTCDHEQKQHSWGSCDVGNCECEAGWEE